MLLSLYCPCMQGLRGEKGDEGDPGTRGLTGKPVSDLCIW